MKSGHLHQEDFQYIYIYIYRERKREREGERERERERERKRYEEEEERDLKQADLYSLIGSIYFPSFSTFLSIRKLSEVNHWEIGM